MVEGNGTQRELGSIQATLSAIQTDLQDAKNARRQVYQKLEEQGREIAGLKSDVAAVKTAVDEMRPHIDDWRTTKAKGLGILVGVALAGGGVATGLSKLLAKLGFTS